MISSTNEKFRKWSRLNLFWLSKPHKRICRSYNSLSPLVRFSSTTSTIIGALVKEIMRGLKILPGRNWIWFWTSDQLGQQTFFLNFSEVQTTITYNSKNRNYVFRVKSGSVQYERLLFAPRRYFRCSVCGFAQELHPVLDCVRDLLFRFRLHKFLVSAENQEWSVAISRRRQWR